MIRLFVSPELLRAGELRVAGDEHHYVMRVRRARVGDAVELVDGAGRRADATIQRIADAETVLAVGEPRALEARPPFVRALVPLIKGDRMDYCLEKLVEVGVDAITVWPAARSVVVLDPSKRDARLAKYRAAAQSAARQCGRAQVPDVSLAEDLRGALAALPDDDLRLLLAPTTDAPLHATLAASITVLSGPEGGLAPAELDQLSAFLPISLGPRILRAETAPVVAVALLRAATHS